MKELSRLAPEGQVSDSAKLAPAQKYLKGLELSLQGHLHNPASLPERWQRIAIVRGTHFPFKLHVPCSLCIILHQGQGHDPDTAPSEHVFSNAINVQLNPEAHGREQSTCVS